MSLTEKQTKIKEKTNMQRKFLELSLITDYAKQFDLALYFISQIPCSSQKSMKNVKLSIFITSRG